MPRPDQTESMRSLRAATLDRIYHTLTQGHMETECEVAKVTYRHLTTLIDLYLGTLPRTYSLRQEGDKK
jgi:hypothetical protein